jgi:hypothetical protein
MNIRTWGIVTTGIIFLATSGVAFGLVNGPSARTTFFAVLVGGNEVSNDGQARVGDPDGRGSATIIIPSSGTLCFATLVTGIDTPVAAHVHNELAGRNGPIVVTLTPPDQGNPGSSSGCVTNLGPELLNAITLNPGAFYVNVHTGLFPDGALRGQLF